MHYLTAVFCVLFLFSFYRDNRSLWNPALLIISLFFLYLSATEKLYNMGYETAHNILFGLGFVLLPILVLLSGLFLIYNGIVLLKKEGRSKANYLSLALGFVILFFYFLVYLRFTLFSDAVEQNPIINTIFLLVIFSYVIFGFAFAGFMIYSYLYLFIPKKKSYDFIIIHGAGLLGGEKVTPLLKHRIDKAVEAYHKSKNPNIKIIASGGQGVDEKISEAQAIANYLLEGTDVPKEAIILEDKSTTTYENLLFSKEIGEKLIENPRFLFVTNDYHVFRTSVFARQMKLKGDGLGCRTAAYYIPSAFIREYVALCVHMKWLFIGFYGVFFLFALLSYL